MQNYYLSATRETPEVSINFEKGIVSIKGRSHPENSGAFYKPIFGEIQKLVNSKKAISLIELQLEYFNSTSFKLIIEILYILKKAEHSESTLNVRWIYDEDDEDILFLGQEMERSVGLTFEFQSYKNT